MSIKTFFTGFKEGFRDFNNLVVLVVNSILLSIVYLIGIGFTSIFAKMFKKSFLDIKKIKKESYWEGLNLKKENIEKYYRQF